VDNFGQILSLPSFGRARSFLRLAARWDRSQSERSQSRPNDADQGPSSRFAIRSHVQLLSKNAQYELLGLPNALVGLASLARQRMPLWSVDVAKELALEAMVGSVGECEINDKKGAWIVKAISLCRQNGGMPAAKLESPATAAFFETAASLLRRYPGIDFKEVYGAVFPVLDSLDPVFEDLDVRARKIGGMRLLKWVLGPGTNDPDLLRDMLLSYACKYIRKDDLRPQPQERTEVLLQDLVKITRQLSGILRTNSVSNVGERWALPAFVLEEVVRRSVSHALNGRRSRQHKKGADIEFADYLMRTTADAKTSGAWAKARQGMARRPEGEIFITPTSLLSSSWVFTEPPCREYGVSFRTALRRDLGRRPFISLRKGRTLMSPRPGNSELVFDVQDRLCLSSAELGMVFENFINLKLSRFSALRGTYQASGESDITGDVDALIVCSDGSVVVVFECKSGSEVRDSWFGGSYAMFEHFKRSFLKSQEQLLRFEATLMADGEVELHHDKHSDLVRVPDRVIRVSVVLRSHGESMHRPGFANALLSHFCGVSLHFTPASGQSLPLEVSKTEKELENVQGRIHEHLKILGDPEHIFTRTLFLDLETLAYVVDRAQSVDELIQTLDTAAKHRDIGRVISVGGPSA